MNNNLDNEILNNKNLGDKVIPAPIGLVMGSDSDWKVMQKTAEILEKFKIAYNKQVLSAHRMPDEMFTYAESAQEKGLKVIIAGAGGAAHLPGMLAAKTIIPVLGVPVASRYLQGVDSLYSIVQMPSGVPVASFAIGEAGAINAALFAIAILANDPIYDQLKTQLEIYRSDLHQQACQMVLPPSEEKGLKLMTKLGKKLSSLIKS